MLKILGLLPVEFHQVANEIVHPHYHACLWDEIQSLSGTQTVSSPTSGVWWQLEMVSPFLD